MREQWDPLDTSPHATLAAWMRVWPSAAFAQTLDDAVLPHLLRALHAMRFDAPQPQLHAVQALHAWADVLPRATLECALEGEVLAKFTSSLRAALVDAARHATDGGGVARGVAVAWNMYSSFRGSLVSPLCDVPVVRRALSHALAMIRATLAECAQGGTTGDQAVRATLDTLCADVIRQDDATFETVRAARLVALSNAEAHDRAAQGSAAPHVAPSAVDRSHDNIARPRLGATASGEWSVPDVLQRLAERAGVAFLPRGSLTVAGSTYPAYTIGNARAYIRGGVVHVKPEAGLVAKGTTPEAWLPMSLEDAVAAGSATPAAET